MKVETVALSGFRSWMQPQTIQFRRGMVAIVGESHSGKSSLIEAVAWALAGGPYQELIAQGCDQTSVEVVFTTPAGRWRVRRVGSRKGRGEAKAWLEQDVDGRWEPVSQDGSVRQTSAQIATVLGMSQRVSEATWLSRQDESGLFCQMDPARRRTLLAEMFGLDIYSQLADAADDQLREASRQAAASQGALDALQTQLAMLGDPADRPAAEQNLDQARGRTAQLMRELEEDPETELAGLLHGHQQATLAWKDACDKARSRLEAAVSEATAARTDLDDLGRAADGLPQVSEQLAAADTEADSLEQQAGQVRGQLEQANSVLAAVQARLDDVMEAGRRAASRRGRLADLEGKRCPTCQQVLGHEAAAEVLSSQDQTLLELRRQHRMLAGQKDQCARQVVPLRARLEEIQAQTVAAAQTVRGLRDRRAAGVSAQQRLPAGRQRFTNAQAAAGRAKADWEQTVAGRPVLDEGRVAELRQVADPGRRERLTQQLAQARADEQEWALVLARAASRDGLLVSVDAARQEAEGAGRSAKDLDMLRQAFRPSGIPAMILPAICQEITVEANMVLAGTGDDDLNVLVDMSDKDEVLVHGVGVKGARGYRRFSGSERFRMSLALRVALLRCVGKRTGAQIGTLIIDEGFGSLDTATRAAVASLLERIAASGLDVWMVTHMDDLKDRFPAHLEISSGSGTSRARWV